MLKSVKIFAGPKPLSRLMPNVMQPALRKKSFAEANLILNWHIIIKTDFAQRCYPERLFFAPGTREEGTLIIAVDSSSSLLIQHSEYLLIDAINAYFGYRVVNRLKLRHTYIPQKIKPNILTKNKVEKIERQDLKIESIQDLDLKAALISIDQTFHDFHHMK